MNKDGTVRPGNTGSVPNRGINFFQLLCVLIGSRSTNTLLFYGEWGSFLDVKGWGVKLTTHLRVMQRINSCELHLFYPTGFHGVVVN
jgi:hypothetical protein